MHVAEFQDELKKAVSARGNRHSYSDDFDDDEGGDDDDDDGRFYSAMLIKNMFTVLYYTTGILRATDLTLNQFAYFLSNVCNSVFLIVLYLYI